MNRPLKIIGNWKMHKSLEEALQFVEGLPPEMFGYSDVYLAVPFTVLAVVAKAVKEGLIVGTQNISEHLEGAYTGEISVRMAHLAGAKFSLVGHSERRTHYHETNEIVAKKAKACLKGGLRPVVCIGETAAERTAQRTEEVLTKQLRESIEHLSSEEIAHSVIAYEPVWAIGTGHTATAAMAQDVHQLCRHLIRKKYGAPIADKLPILYGGSVNPKTIEELIQQPDIDGALVGGASLDVDSFVKIVTIARNYQS